MNTRIQTIDITQTPKVGNIFYICSYTVPSEFEGWYFSMGGTMEEETE